MIKRCSIKLNEILIGFNSTRKSRGILPATLEILKKILKRIQIHVFGCNDYILFARSLEDAIPAAKSVEGIRIRKAEADDLHLFESALKLSNFLWFKLLFENGRTCLMALKDNRLVACGSFASEVNPYLEYLRIPLAQDEVYVIQIYTVPAFRRQGIQTMLYQEMFRLMREKGYRRVLTMAESNNMPSLRFHRKLGYQAISRSTRCRNPILRLSLNTLERLKYYIGRGG